MKLKRNILYIVIAVILIVGCTGKSSLPFGEGGGRDHWSQTSDTLYTEEAAMDVYAEHPERAIQILDSAEIVGNLTRDRADLMRAKVYSYAYESARQDTAIVICERLLMSKTARENLSFRQMVLELLTYSARQLQDFELLLQYNTELASVCRQQDCETEALRTEAEIGAVLVRLGKADEGFSRLDSVLSLLDNVRQFNELDASIIAAKRKVSALEQEDRQADIIPAVQHILNRLADYEQHPADYHDGTYREPSDEDRPGYIGFYRSQCYAFLASAYATLNETGKAREFLALFEQTDLAKTLDGRKLVASAQCKLGEYDKMEAIYRELETVFMERGDTITPDYASLLRDRAIAADAQGRLAESIALWQKHAEVLQEADERLLKGKAHLYAARYHAQEQQQEIERQKAYKRYVSMMAFLIGILALTGLFFAWYAARQWRKTQLKNRVLAQQIKEAMIYKEKYEEREKGKVISEKFATAIPSASGTPEQIAIHSSLDEMSPEELFHYIEHEVSRRLLFLNPSFDRQAIIDEFHISKERVGAAFSQGSKYDSMTQFVSDLRLEYASKLLVTTDLSITEIMTKAGFSNASVFSRYFSRKYQITPTQYRRANSE